MALFKISKGSKNNLPTELTEGYCWYTHDDSKFYIDFKDENGVLTRKALNAQDAETLGLHTADEFILEADKQKLINEVLEQIPDSGITDEEKQEIVADVLEQVPNQVIGSVGEKSLVGNETNLNTASGKWSVALNYNTTASGSNAVATGTTTTAGGAAAFSANCGTEATGDISTAFGNYTKATTTYAFSSGDHTEANGVASFAANHNNKADGQNSFATGSTNTVTGKNGFVAGASNTVSGESSSAFGLLNEVSGKYSHAFGQDNEVTHNYSTAHGYNQKNGGHFSHTFNHSTETVADNQSAFGQYNKASSDSLFMIGIGTSDTARKNAFEVKKNGTIMIGNAPLTEEKVNSIGELPDFPVKAGTGTNSTISNDHSHNIASGNYSNATGFATMANGDKAHAEGDNTKAAGTASHAEGFGVHALSAYQHAQGKWNVVDTAGKYAHIVGNGDTSTRSNAHTVDWSGVGWFAGGLKVGGTGQDDSNAVDVLTSGNIGEYIESGTSDFIKYEVSSKTEIETPIVIDGYCKLKLVGDKLLLQKKTYNSNIIYCSEDGGVSWTECTSLSYYEVSILDIAYGNGVYVAVNSGLGEIVYSHDFITWDSISMNTYPVLGTVCYGEGMFLVTTRGNNKFYYSSDGINWSSCPGAGAINPESTSNDNYNLCYGDGKFVSFCSNRGCFAAYRYIDDATWHPCNISGNGTLGFHMVLYADGRYLALGRDYSTLYYSENGIDWSNIHSTVNGNVYDYSHCCYFNGLYLLNWGACYSEDCKKWYKNSSSLVSSFKVMSSNGNSLLAVKESDTKIYSSADGKTWSLFYDYDYSMTFEGKDITQEVSDSVLSCADMSKIPGLSEALNNKANTDEVLTEEDYNELKSMIDSKTSQDVLDSKLSTFSSTYETKDDAQAKLDESKAYTDQKISDLLDGADDATLDSIKELSDAIKENDTAIEALNSIASSKASQTSLDAIEGRVGVLESRSDGSTASGLNSTAEGYKTTASGDYSVAQGAGTLASGVGSFATGDQSEAHAVYSLAGGSKSKTLEGCGSSIAYGGYAIAAGIASQAFGYDVQAEKDYAFASGNITRAKGKSSVVMGYNNTVFSDYGFAVGSTNNVIGYAGFASGSNNTVGKTLDDGKTLGNYSAAFGDHHMITGNYSTAQGYGTSNAGHYAHTFNRETSTLAGSQYQTAFGYFNDPKENSLFMIGFGTKEAPLNVFEVDQNGTVQIKSASSTVPPTLKLGNSAMTDASLSKMSALVSYGGEALYLKSSTGSGITFKITVNDEGTLSIVRDN